MYLLYCTNRTIEIGFFMTYDYVIIDVINHSS